MIDYKSAWKNLLFDFWKMLLDDFDRIEEANKINIYEIQYDNYRAIYKHSKQCLLNRMYYYKHYDLILNTVLTNTDYILKNIEIQDLIYLIDENKLSHYRNAPYEDKMGSYPSLFELTLQNFFLEKFTIKLYEVNDEIIDKVKERRWICACGKRILPNSYNKHLTICHFVNCEK